MKAEIINMLSTGSQLETRITHKDEELKFSISCFGRDSFQQGFDIFEHTNLFWASMPEADQDYLFSLYRHARLILNTARNRSTLTEELSKTVVELLRFQSLEKATHWASFTPTINVPAIFKPEYIDSIDRQGSREQTYVSGEYLELVAMALVFRAMVPIWGEFIGQTRQETGTQFKEFYAFHLINCSEIIDSRPMHRLRVYIDRNAGEERYNPANIMDGISSEDFPYWMLSLVVIRRLCVGDIRGFDLKANIVTYIHKFITNRVRGTDSMSDNIVKIKKNDATSGTQETQVSSIERYKIKFNISVGEIEELNFSASDMRNIAYRLTGQMTDELFNKSMRTSRQLGAHPLMTPQVTLLRWVFKPVISPQGMMYLEKEILVKAMGVLEAVLWARGHKMLALIASSYANISANEMFVSSDNPRTRISKEMLAELDVLYPHCKVTGGTKTGQKLVNLTTAAIDNLTNNLSMYSWNMTADDAKIAEVFGNSNSRRLSLPSDIKSQLAALAIELGKRNWK